MRFRFLHRNIIDDINTVQRREIMGKAIYKWYSNEDQAVFPRNSLDLACDILYSTDLGNDLINERIAGKNLFGLKDYLREEQNLRIEIYNWFENGCNQINIR